MHYGRATRVADVPSGEGLFKVIEQVLDGNRAHCHPRDSFEEWYCALCSRLFAWKGGGTGLQPCLLQSFFRAKSVWAPLERPAFLSLRVIIPSQKASEVLGFPLSTNLVREADRTHIGL